MATNALHRVFGPFFSGGSLAASAVVYHYVAGTTTDKDMWSDRAKTTTVAQPLVLDANGVGEAFADGIYKFVVKTAVGGTTLYTFDNVNVAEVDTVGEGSALASAATLTLGTDGNFFHVTGATGITAISGTQPIVWLAFDSTPTLTNSGNLILQDSRDFIAAAGDVMAFINDGSGVWREGSRRLATGLTGSQIADQNKNELVKFTTTASAVNEWTVTNAATGNGPILSATGGDANISPILKSKGTGEVLHHDGNGVNVGFAPRSYLAGCTLSTAGSSATMSIAAGMARDSTNAKNLVLAAISKTTAAWAVGTGNGGLDTGAIGNNSWYHFYVIMRSDTGVVDVLISASASSPTMPTNYDYKRRIGSGRTNGSAQWVLFTQIGDLYLWSASVLDGNATSPGNSAVTRTLTVPTGVKVLAYINANVQNSDAGTNRLYVSSLDASDEAPSGSAAPLSSVVKGSTAGLEASVNMFVETNASAQIRTRGDNSTANLIHRIATLGWMDRRGRDD